LSICFAEREKGKFSASTGGPLVSILINGEKRERRKIFGEMGKPQFSLP